MTEIDNKLTQEEIAVLKEVAQDRLAVSRVTRKVKNVALTISAIVAAYILVADSFIQWIRAKVGF